MPPPNFPPNFPPNLPPEPFHNGTRHDFSENYPYHNEYRGYSGWEATGLRSPPPAEDAYEYEYGVAAYERSFGEGPYGEVAGRYGFCHTPDDRHYFQQQRETTRKHYYGLSAAAPDTFQSRIYGDGYDISTDSRTPQQQQQHQHQQNATWAPLPQSGGGDAVPLPRLHRPHWEYHLRPPRSRPPQPVLRLPSPPRRRPPLPVLRLPSPPSRRRLPQDIPRHLPPMQRGWWARGATSACREGPGRRVASFQPCRRKSSLRRSRMRRHSTTG